MIELLMVSMVALGAVGFFAVGYVAFETLKIKKTERTIRESSRDYLAHMES